MRCFLTQQVKCITQVRHHKYSTNMTSTVFLEVLEKEYFPIQVENPLTCLHGPSASHVVRMIKV